MRSLVSIWSGAVLSLIAVSANVRADELQETADVLSHDVMLMDVSDSMSWDDLQAAFQGVSAYYKSESALDNYKMGICTANTIVFYGTKTFTTSTSIICSANEAIKFSEDLSNTSIPAVRTITSTATNVASALAAADNVFQGEAEILKIKAAQHRVVLVGDEMGSAVDAISFHSRQISSKYGATIHAFAIGDESLAAAFQTSLVTQPNTQQVIKMPNGRERKRPIAAGMAAFAVSGEQVSKKLSDFLSFGGY